MDRLIRFGVITTVVALLGWPAPIVGGPTVPYRDQVSGTGTIVNVSPPTVTVQLAGLGVATHLGVCKVVGIHQLTFTSPTGGIVAGSGSYTTPDGANLFATYSGTFTQNADGSRTLFLTAVVTGGTQRLKGVSGNLSLTVAVLPTATPTVTTFSYSASGFLTSP